MTGLVQVPTAFQHYSYQKSGDRLMVADVQGVEGPATASNQQYIFTDPQILSDLGGSGESVYGVGDMGMQSIHAFLTGHRCGHVCRTMNLHHSSVVVAGELAKVNTVTLDSAQQEYDTQVLQSVEESYSKQKKIAATVLIAGCVFAAGLAFQHWWSAYTASQTT